MSYLPAMRQPRFMRCMRVLAWFALLLTICPAYAGPTVTAGHPAHVMPAHDEAVPAAQHADVRQIVHHGDSDDCCGKPDRGICHCDAMCGGACLPSVPFVAGAVALAGTRYAASPAREAPVRDPVPPLRPPSA
jgi:hypothetical protein